eukprot:jgi/Botrbrau1/12655/Bobra.67_1s0020.2
MALPFDILLLVWARGKLYCALTCSVMSKNWAGVANHIEGYRYRRAKELLDQGQTQLMEEPELASSEDEELPLPPEEDPQSSDLGNEGPIHAISEDDEDIPMACEDAGLKRNGPVQISREKGVVIGLAPSGGNKRLLARQRGKRGPKPSSAKRGKLLRHEP